MKNELQKKFGVPPVGSFGDFRSRYPLHVDDLVSIFRVDRKLDGPEQFEDYSQRVGGQLASLLTATSYLQRYNTLSLSKSLGVSVRTMQRLRIKIDLPKTFLQYLYLLQV